eukprot:1152374-Pelagomonas_calceolata.AAC.9
MHVANTFSIAFRKATKAVLILPPQAVWTLLSYKNPAALPSRKLVQETFAPRGTTMPQKPQKHKCDEMHA